MRHSAPSGRRARLAGLTVAAVAVSLLVAPGTGAARDRAAGVPEVDEIVSSPNLTQVAHLDRTGPFAGNSAMNTDWAFQGKYAYGGNFNGFAVYDISNPRQPKLATQVLCPGPQNDVTVHGKLLFLATDPDRTDDSCSSTAPDPAAPAEARWAGIKIFDISDPLNPRYVKAVKADCGAHTLTLVPGKAGDRSVYLYLSGFSLPGLSLPNCAAPHDKISIVKVPLHNPAAARVVATPLLFPDGGNPGEGSTMVPTSGCHDITVYPALDLAAGACMGDGVLMTIGDRTRPKVITTVRDTENFAFWHSATFNNTGTKVVFTDELGGGLAATCTAEIGPNRGANAVYDITGKGDKRKLAFRSYYKIPRVNAGTENCVAHNGSLIPVDGRDIMVQAWYQGGVSVWDFTDSRKPVEIAYWERGPLSADTLILGGSWSAYWYNGFIYSSDIVKGVDVLELNDPRTDPAKDKHTRRFNAQTQSSYTDW